MKCLQFKGLNCRNNDVASSQHKLLAVL